VEPTYEEAAPVKITAMVPPTPELDPESEGEYVAPLEAPVEAVAMEAPVESEFTEEPAAQPEYAEPAAPVEYAEQPVYENYEAPVEPYAAPAEEYVAPPEAWEQQAQQPVQQEYYDPAQYAPPQAAAVPPPPSLVPPYPQPPMQQQVPPQYGYGQAPPHPGYPQRGAAPGQVYPGGYQPTRNVPSWALLLVGTLVGFLVAMVIFKFTGMGAALRGDLITEGREKASKQYEAKLKQLKDDGYDDEEEAPKKEEEPKKDEDADPDKADPVPEP
jgi:hypothetical protein